jgi:hypothetical protein
MAMPKVVGSKSVLPPRHLLGWVRQRTRVWWILTQQPARTMLPQLMRLQRPTLPRMM